MIAGLRRWWWGLPKFPCAVCGRRVRRRDLLPIEAGKGVCATGGCVGRWAEERYGRMQEECSRRQKAETLGALYGTGGVVTSRISLPRRDFFWEQGR